MTNRKASQEQPSTPLTGTEYWAGVQGGHDVQIPVADIATYVAQSGAFAAGENVTLSFDPDTKKLIIGSTGGGTSGGGTVTSVGLLNGDGITISGATITTSGNFTVGLAATSVTPATYTFATITVDSHGRITSASNGTPLPTIQGVSGSYVLASVDVDTHGRITGASSAPSDGTLVGSYTSANITVDAYGRITSVANGSGLSIVGTVTPGSYVLSSVTIDSYGRVTNASNAPSNGNLVGTWAMPSITVDTYGRITAIDNGSLPTLSPNPAGTFGNISSVTVDANGRVTAVSSATPNTPLAASYTLANITVDAYGKITAASNGTITLPNLVSDPSGTFTNATVTVDAKGRVTSASNGSAPGAGGIYAGDIIIDPLDGTKNKIAKIQGKTVTASTPSHHNVLIYDAPSDSWIPLAIANLTVGAPSGSYGGGVGRVSVGHLYGLFTQSPGTMDLTHPNASTSAAPQVLTVYKFADMANPLSGASWTTTLTTSTYPNMRLTMDTIANSSITNGIVANRSYWESIAAYSDKVYVAFGMRATGDQVCTQPYFGFTIVALNASDGTTAWTLNIGPYDGTHAFDYIKDLAADPTGVILQTDANIYRITSAGVLSWTYALKQNGTITSVTFKTGVGSNTVSVSCPQNYHTSFCLDYVGGLYVKEAGSVSKIDISNGAQIWGVTYTASAQDSISLFTSGNYYDNIGIGLCNGNVATIIYPSPTIPTLAVYNASTSALVSSVALGSTLNSFGLIVGNNVFYTSTTGNGFTYDNQTTLSGSTLTKISSSIVLTQRTYAASATYDNYTWFSYNNSNGSGTITKVDPSTLAVIQSWTVSAISGFFFRGFAAGSL